MSKNNSVLKNFDELSEFIKSNVSIYNKLSDIINSKLNQENNELKKQIEQLKQQIEQLKQQIEQLEQGDNEQTQAKKNSSSKNGKSNKKEMVSLRNRLCEFMKEAETAEANVIYAKLFGKIGQPVQKLFALAKEEEEREDYEWILENEIRTPIREAFESFQVTFTKGKISLPAEKAKEKPELTELSKTLSKDQLNNEITKCNERIARAKIYNTPKGAIEGAAESLRSLIKDDPAAKLDLQELKGLSEKIEVAFTKNGIRPLFRRDEEVLNRPDLCTLFIEVRGNELIWPGLFIVIDKKLQMYGNFQGTCHPGEWDVENTNQESASTNQKDLETEDENLEKRDEYEQN